MRTGRDTRFRAQCRTCQYGRLLRAANLPRAFRRRRVVATEPSTSGAESLACALTCASVDHLRVRSMVVRGCIRETFVALVGLDWSRRRRRGPRRRDLSKAAPLVAWRRCASGLFHSVDLVRPFHGFAGTQRRRHVVTNQDHRALSYTLHSVRQGITVGDLISFWGSVLEGAARSVQGQRFIQVPCIWNGIQMYRMVVYD
jgi:hypothetical protein